MKRMLFMVALLTALAAGVATASGAGEGVGAGAAAAVKLSLLNSNTEKPERAEFFTSTAEKYRELHPNVTIDVTGVGFGDLNTQILTAINAGAPYDIFTATSELWVNKGIALNLAPYLNANNGAWKNTLADTLLQAITNPDGSAYMMGFYLDTTPLLYHKEIFTKLNLKVPTNTQEFLAVAEALKGAGYIPFQVHGSMMDDLLNLIGWQFAAKYGVEPLDVVQGKVPFTDAWYKDSLTFLKEVYTRGYLPANFWSVSGTEGRNAYATSKIAMRFGFYWDVDTQKDMGMPYENQGVAAFPNLTGVSGIKVYKGMLVAGVMVHKDTKHPDVAVDYVKFLTNKQNQDDMAYKYFGRYPNGMPTVNKETKLSPYASSYINDLAQGIATRYGILDVSLKYIDVLGQQLPLLMQGKITVDQAAAEMDKVRGQ